MRLTKREVETYNIIKTFIRKNKYSPTYKEIAYLLGIHSIAAAFEYVKRLIYKGYISKELNVNRSIIILKKL